MFDFQFPGSQMPYINNIIKQCAENQISNSEFLKYEINEFLTSPKRADMIKGINYYRGMHDILMHKRQAIGDDGKMIDMPMLPNSRIVNNQYRKMVEQKANYLCGKPITYNCDNKDMLKKVTSILGSSFSKALKQVCVDSLNCGIGWLFITYNKRGKLCFKRFNPWEVIAGWRDAENNELDYAIRVYDAVVYEGKKRTIKRKAELFDSSGIKRFILEGGALIPDGIDWETPYFYRGNTAINWTEIPLIPFRYNNNETPLIKNCKSLQDALNTMMSNYVDNMQEDSGNTILVVKNYDGENLGEFRHNLATYRAVKVNTTEGSNGGVDTLSIEVNSENYKVIIDLLKKAIIENCMGYDAKDERLGGNANQMNIQSMYSDIDLDANGMETEYQSSFEALLEFVKAHIANTGGKITGDNIEVIFNKDILINETEVIDNCTKSIGILSNETILSQHPWIDNVEKEIKKIKSEGSEVYEEPNRNGIDE